MEIAKLYEDEIFQIESHMYNTEKAICYALDQYGLKLGEDFIFFEEIDNIPFTKRRKHKVDVVLTFRKDRTKKLYVEIKGQMTYLEVNKLKYLSNETGKHFYILQLTELDWIEPYMGQSAKDAFDKSKKIFETQIQELVKFVNGEVKGKTLSDRSKKRLKAYLKYRKHDLSRWKTNSNDMGV